MRISAPPPPPPPPLAPRVGLPRPGGVAGSPAMGDGGGSMAAAGLGVASGGASLGAAGLGGGGGSMAAAGLGVASGGASLGAAGLGGGGGSMAAAGLVSFLSIISTLCCLCPVEQASRECESASTSGSTRHSDLGVGLSLVFLLGKTFDEFNKMVKVRAEMEALLKQFKHQVRGTSGGNGHDVLEPRDL